jgi:ferredoxin
VDPSTTLFTAARSLGLPVGTACQAEGICGRCGLRPVAGAEHLSPETDQERRVKRDNAVDPALRLSCQVRALGGPVVLTADYW